TVRVGISDLAGRLAACESLRVGPEPADLFVHRCTSLSWWCNDRLSAGSATRRGNARTYAQPCGRRRAALGDEDTQPRNHHAKPILPEPGREQDPPLHRVRDGGEVYRRPEPERETRQSREARTRRLAGHRSAGLLEKVRIKSDSHGRVTSVS